MSFSAVVDYRYRLVAADLNGRARMVIVTRVSYQGVENLQPLLHFEGIGKPLALDLHQRSVVAEIARSNVISDWHGVMLELHPVRVGDRETIVITPVGLRRNELRAWIEPVLESLQPRQVITPVSAPPVVEQQPSELPVATPNPVVPAYITPAPPQQWFSAQDVPSAPAWLPVVLGLLLLLAFGTVLWLESSEGAWVWLESFLP